MTRLPPTEVVAQDAEIVERNVRELRAARYFAVCPNAVCRGLAARSFTLMYPRSVTSTPARLEPETVGVGSAPGGNQHVASLR